MVTKLSPSSSEFSASHQEDAARKRRMREGGRAILAAVAAMPAAGVSAQEAAFHAFTGPQSYVTQAGEDGMADHPFLTPIDLPGTGFDVPPPGVSGEACITHALPDAPKGAYVEFNLNYGIRPSVTPVRLTEIGVMPNLPGKNCMTLAEFREGAESRAADFGRDLAAAVRGVAEKTGRPDIARGVEVLEDPAALDHLMGYADAAEMLFKRAAGADSSLWQSDFPARGIAQRKEAFIAESVANGIPQIEQDLRNPQLELQGIPINFVVPEGGRLDAWQPRQAVLRVGDAAQIIPAQAQTEHAPLTPGQRGAVCVEYKSATNGEARLIVANPSGSGTFFHDPAAHGPIGDANWRDIHCLSLEEFRDGAKARATAFARDVAQFARDVADGTGRPELAQGLDALQDPNLADDLEAANREAVLTFRRVTEAVADVDPAVLQAAVAPERLQSIMERGAQGYAELRMMRNVEAVMTGLETRLGPRVEQPMGGQPVGDPIRFEGSGDGFNIREWRIRRDGPAPTHQPRSIAI